MKEEKTRGESLTKQGVGTCLGLNFTRPSFGLYVTNPLWDPEIIRPPWEFDEEAAYVASRRDYRPVPFPDFKRSLEAMGCSGCMAFNDGAFKEEIDFSALEISRNLIFFLSPKHGVLVRVRADKSQSEDRRYHTMKIIGSEEGIMRIAQEINIPHPLHDLEYPHRALFIDRRETPLRVLAK